MSGEEPVSDNAEKTESAGRERSTIAFPYSDLNSAAELAEAIHRNVGNGTCDDDQLAAWTNQSPKSSGFRTQVYAARNFGVLEGEAGRHLLSELGRMFVDPNRAREAKVKAFLNVPLYKAIFEAYKGGVIPPAAALERDINKMGVAEKQKDRARQVFERSAEQAGFFEHGRNRLVAPGIQSAYTPPPRDTPPPSDSRGSNGEVGNGSSGGGNGGGGGSGGNATGDPLVDALVMKLPKAGLKWSPEERKTWLKMIEMAFDLAYGVTSQTNA